MKKLRIISLVLLAVTLLAAVYLTLGYLYALMPGQDGIPRITWFLYGDNGWTYELYYNGAAAAMKIFTVVALENIALAVLGECKKCEKDRK